MICKSCGKDAELIQYDKNYFYTPYEGLCKECQKKSFEIQLAKLDEGIYYREKTLEQIRAFNESKRTRRTS